jgi:hypothetical protein
VFKIILFILYLKYLHYPWHKELFSCSAEKRERFKTSGEEGQTFSFG